MSNLYYHSNLGVLGKKVSSDVLQTTLEYIFKSLKKKMILKRKQFIFSFELLVNPSSANPTKWSNILKQFVGKSVFECVLPFPGVGA